MHRWILGRSRRATHSIVPPGTSLQSYACTVARSSSVLAQHRPNAAYNKADGKPLQWRTTGQHSTLPVQVDDRAIRTRHLLRSILRECTYLPDRHSREWVRHYVLKRFRTYNFKAWKHSDDPNYPVRLREKEKEARAGLASLRRANDGNRACLMRVLFMAYGRIGKRRHELMMPLIRAQYKAASATPEVQDQEGDEEDALQEILEGQTKAEGADETLISAQNNNFEPSATRKEQPAITPQLRALLTSQIQASPPDLTRRNPRRITLEIPLFNSWLRPMPQKRIKNMRQKHYANLLDRVLPPLPTQDWQHLFNLATGRSPIDPPKPRRKRVVSEDNGGHAQQDSSALNVVLAFGKPPNKVLNDRRRHAITPRYMRRLYAQVFSQCPLMDWDTTTNDWKITWGEHALQKFQSTVHLPNLKLYPESSLQAASASMPGD